MGICPTLFEALAEILFDAADARDAAEKSGVTFPNFALCTIFIRS